MISRVNFSGVIKTKLTFLSCIFSWIFFVGLLFYWPLLICLGLSLAFFVDWILLLVIAIFSTSLGLFIFSLELFLCLGCLLLTFLGSFTIVLYGLAICIRFDEIFTTFGSIIRNLRAQLMTKLTCVHCVLLSFIIIVRDYN